MKIIAWIFGGLLVLLVALFVLQMVASERVEVVELHTQGDQGEETTRVWIVDHEGMAYLRAGSQSSGWFRRLSAHPEVQVERNGKLRDYIAVPRPEMRDIINYHMAEKYTWGNTLIGIIVGSRDNATPVELQPVQ